MQHFLWVVHDKDELLAWTSPGQQLLQHIAVVLWEGSKDYSAEVARRWQEVSKVFERLRVPAM